MNFRKLIALMIVMIPLLFLGACTTNGDDTREGVRVVFNLEGGTYRNSTRAVEFYYKFEKGTSNLIQELTYFSNEKLTRPGYELEGWYTTKNGDGENATYSNKWDFSSDHVNDEGITLYARWMPTIKYTYQVCYYDDDGTTKVLGEYTVKAGAKFRDTSNYASLLANHTALRFVDSENNLWDENFTHPGGDSDLAIAVYVEYLEGDYALVSTYSELVSNKGKNIYLLNDIDCDGKSLKLSDNNGNYTFTFIGNGHTISNFTIGYDPTRNGLIDDFEDPNLNANCISIFGNATNANISNVKFTNFSVDVSISVSLCNKIYISPIAVSITNTKIENVQGEGTYTISRTPEDFNQENLIIVTDDGCYKKDTQSVVQTTIIFNQYEEEIQ